MSLFSRAPRAAQLAVCALAVLLPAALRAQTADVSIVGARADHLDTGAWIVTVTFNKGVDVVGFDDPDFGSTSGAATIADPTLNPIVDPANYALVDLAAVLRVPLKRVIFDASAAYDAPLSGRLRPERVQLELVDGATLDTTRAYTVVVSNLRYDGGKTARKLVQSPVAWARPRGARAVEKADDRNDARFYAAGLVAGVRGSALNGTLDFKVQTEEPLELGGRVAYWGVAADFRASSDPKGDPDALSLGASFELPFGRQDNRVGPIRRFILRNTAKLEATRDLDAVNPVLETRVTVLSNSFLVADGAFFYLHPFFGNEFGYAWASPVDEAQGRTIERLLVGARAAFVQALSAEGLKQLQVQASVIHRWPLNDEVHFKDADDDVAAVFLGRAGRTYLDTSFGVDVTSNFGIALSYQWGELPPAYKRVDGKLSLGFTYRAK